MQADPVEIVRLGVEEWQAYRALRLEALRDEPQAFSSRYAEQVEYPDTFWQKRLADAAWNAGAASNAGTDRSSPGGSWLLFARQRGRLVGMIGAYRQEPPHEDTVWIISVYVTPSARGTGVSNRLMSAMLAEVAFAGVKKAQLEVNVNQTAAVHLYQRFGFTVVNEESHLVGSGEYVPEYLMEKAL